jgi:hypothetical protein
MTDTPADRATADRVRIVSPPLHRRLATLTQAVLVILIAGLAWAGMRIAAHFWPATDEPDVARVFWVFVGGLALAGLTLAWLIVLIQDLVKLTIEVDEVGLRVDRLLQPFQARWDEVREVGLVGRSGHLTVRSARGTLTTTARLLGAVPFARLVEALRARAGDHVHEWSAWAAARRQLLVLAVPAVGFAFLLVLGRGLWRRRPGPRPTPR